MTEQHSPANPDRNPGHPLPMSADGGAGRAPSAEAASRSSAADEFARQAEQAPPGLLAEFWDFLIHNKKWWLTPIIIVLLLATALAILQGSAAAPFIYPGL